MVLPLERGDSSAVGRGRAGRQAGPTTTISTAIWLGDLFELNLRVSYESKNKT